MFVFLPLATPEVVLGAALLGLFITMGVGDRLRHHRHRPRHVQRRLRRRDDARAPGGDRPLDRGSGAGPRGDGAADVPAGHAAGDPARALAAGLLTFALSVDDFVITNFTAGQTSTFPLFIYGAARQGVPPQVNVLATILLVAVLALLALNYVVQRGKGRRGNDMVPERTAVAPGLAQ
jgi:spermidine/putrescine transport system permease protein